jgi:choline dehydrogenase
VQTDDDVIREIRARASTSFHPVGSCRMGTDPQAAVESGPKVRGLEGLSIADASVMPQMITGHPNAATIIMVAEKAAALIAERTA